MAACDILVCAHAMLLMHIVGCMRACVLSVLLAFTHGTRFQHAMGSCFMPQEHVFWYSYMVRTASVQVRSCVCAHRSVHRCCGAYACLHTAYEWGAAVTVTVTVFVRVVSVQL